MRYPRVMPLPITAGATTLLVRREAFERVHLDRATIESSVTLTPDEFRIEHGLIAIGPIHGDDDVAVLIDLLESRGLALFDDMFELPGNWPEWLAIFAMTKHAN